MGDIIPRKSNEVFTNCKIQDLKNTERKHIRSETPYGSTK